MSLAAPTLLRTQLRMRALRSLVQQQCSLSSSSSAHASSSSSGGSAPSDADLSRAAFAQRQLLSSLRASSSSSSSSSLGAAAAGTAAQDPHANARAALAGAGGRGGGTGMGLGLGLGSGSIDGAGGSLDRAAGGGKKWRELRGGQKVVRAGLTTSRLLLVLVGGGLTLAVGWAVGSELFASNSPTVIYNDAVKRVRRSAQIQEHLLLPYRFSSSSSYSSDASPLNPSSSSSSRGRKRGSHVSSQVVREGGASGSGSEREVLLLRFFLQAREKDKEWTWAQSARHALQEAGARVKLEALALAAQIGEAVSPALDTTPQQAKAKEEEEKEGQGWWSNPFRRLTKAVSETPLRAKPTPGTWASGEVHAELTRDEEGIFQYRRLYVDIPSSHAATRSRVWLVRREGEVVR